MPMGFSFSDGNVRHQERESTPERVFFRSSGFFPLSDDGQPVFQCSLETFQISRGIEDKAGADIGSVCGTLPDDTDLTPFVRFGTHGFFAAEKADMAIAARAKLMIIFFIIF